MYISLILAVLLAGSTAAFLSRTREQARMIAVASSWAALLISILMFINYEPANGLNNFREFYEWIPRIGINYHVGVDGVSLPMVLLTAIVSAFCAVYAWDEKHRANQFFALLLLMNFSLIGVFVSLDFFLFYIFWELVLIPMFFLIGIWGGPRKDYSAIKFLIYTHVASVVMLLGIFALYYFHGKTTGVYTFDIVMLLSAYQTLPLPSFWREFIFAALLFGFLVKMPAVPFHTWLPDAHVEAPTVGSILLAGVLLKMGGYGLFRFLIPMIPNASHLFIYAIALFGLISILYAPIAALAQPDIKKLIAFSSIGHMGFISLGVAAFMAAGAEVPRIFAASGAMFQLFAHGIITSVLFGSAGIIEHHTGTRIIQDLGGLTKKMPKFAFLMIIGFFASMGFPGMMGFVAEFSILAGSYPQLPYIVIAAMLSIPFTAGYHLWAVQRAMFGPYNEHLGNVTDLTWYEFTAMAAWVLLIIALGLYPMPLFEVMHSTAAQFITILPSGGIVP
ncbi:MAG: NADH-quinone oxidoreductase subunit M [Candidatus Hydrothermarchaeota archaeon]|nr:NADH-quinone oxidoreductase subunit M [Candidatus Hydrothermarchaeota archaeon]